MAGLPLFGGEACEVQTFLFHRKTSRVIYYGSKKETASSPQCTPGFMRRHPQIHLSGTPLFNPVAMRRAPLHQSSEHGNIFVI